MGEPNIRVLALSIMVAAEAIARRHGGMSDVTVPNWHENHAVGHN